MSYSRYSDVNDLNNATEVLYQNDLSHTTNFPIVHITQPFMHQKETDLTSDLMNGHNRLTFTEFLTDQSEQYINEAYDYASQQQQQQQQQHHQHHHHHHHHQHHQQQQLQAHHLVGHQQHHEQLHYHTSHHVAETATTCSSPASDYNLYTNYDDSKVIKIEEYPGSVYNSMTRSLSVDSSYCPELTAICNPATLSAGSLTPISSPLDQSPIMSSSGLPLTPPPHHHDQLHHQVHDPYNLQNLGHEEQEFSDLSIHQSSILMQEQDFQTMVSSLPSPPVTIVKPPGKSRGRRMSNKPTKPGTKCFECTYTGCGRVFKRSEHLKRHIRSIHTLERPFQCNYPHCTKRFSRSDNLSQHLRVHRPNGKDKHSSRIIGNFTPYLQIYHQNANIHSSIGN